MSDRTNEIIMTVGDTPNIDLNVEDTKNITFKMDRYIEREDYEELINIPSINEVPLIKNKTSKDLHVQHEMDEITNQEIDNIIFG